MGAATDHAGDGAFDSAVGPETGMGQACESSSLETGSIKNRPYVRFWGVRGSVPVSGESSWRYGGNTTCVQVCIPDEHRLVVIDMGTGARSLGLEVENNNRTVQGLVFFTHVHWDHIHGVPFFKPFFRSGNRFELFVPEQLSCSARTLLFDQMSAPHFPVSADALSAELHVTCLGSETMNFGSFQLAHLKANHHSNTVMYKLKASGWTLIFAPDNELVKQDLPAMRDFMRDADVLVHDSQYDRAGYAFKKNWGHSAWEDVVDLALECQIKQLVLTHHDPDSDDEVLASREAQLRHMIAGTSLKAVLAREGMVI